MLEAGEYERKLSEKKVGKRSEGQVSQTGSIGQVLDKELGTSYTAATSCSRAVERDLNLWERAQTPQPKARRTDRRGEALFGASEASD